MNKLKITRFLSLGIVTVSLYSIIGYVERVIGLHVANTFLWWTLNALFLVGFIYIAIKSRITTEKRHYRFVHLYLVWIIFNIIRGFFVAETYWDFKNLFDVSMALLLVVVVYTANNLNYIQTIFRAYFKYAIPVFFLTFLLYSPGAYGFYLVPVSFMMLFFPLLSNRNKIIISLFTLLVMTVDLGARSNVIKFGVPVMLLSIYYFRRVINLKILETLRKILFVFPMLFFALGASGVFNIFNMDDYIRGNYYYSSKISDGDREKISLKTDTRTFIYEEVFNTAKVYNTWWFGRSPARGNITTQFADTDLNKRGERYANEATIPNVFTWMGVVGVALYLLVFYRASYLAINKSNNTFAKILGIYIAFRWVYAWVEDVNNFSINYFVLWIMIGLCFSEFFRKMNNREMTIWVRGIFDIRYVEYDLLKKRLKKKECTKLNQ